jgi:hypothetical protein
MARKKRPSDLTTHSHAAIRAFAQVVIPPLPLVLRYMMRGRSPWGPAMGCSVAWSADTEGQGAGRGCPACHGG